MVLHLGLLVGLRNKIPESRILDPWFYSLPQMPIWGLQFAADLARTLLGRAHFSHQKTNVFLFQNVCWPCYLRYVT